MSTTKTQRIISLALALIFFVSTVAIAAFYVLTNSGQQDVEISNQIENGGETLAGTSLSGFEPVAQVTELQKIDLVEGSGTEAKEGDTITVNYTGALASDGTIFESSLDTGQPITFSLSGVIEGWQQGIPGMKEGGTRRLIIPASLAYGDQETANIPANSALVFDVELITIGN
jgi:FKBP-type peptidyl-prolyl cis-trans isomerase